jgi:hypothetical protein
MFKTERFRRIPCYGFGQITGVLRLGRFKELKKSKKNLKFDENKSSIEGRPFCFSTLWVSPQEE